MSATTRTAAAGFTIVIGFVVALAAPFDRQTSLPHDFLGRWYLAGSGGGIAGEISDGGDGSSIVLTDDNEIEHYGPDGALLATESFSLSRGSTIFGAEEGWILDAEAAVPRVVRADGDRLSISDNVYDGFGAWYTRTR